jgi:hypothetical protein
MSAVPTTNDPQTGPNSAGMVPTPAAAGRWHFLGLLVILAVLFVVYPGLHDLPAGPAAFLVVKVIVFAACGRVIFRGRGNVAVAAVLGAPVLAAAAALLVVPESARAAVATVGHLFGAAFLGFSVVVMLRMIYRQAEVSLDGVFGGISAYVLLAIAFAHAYAVMEVVSPGSFRPAEGTVVQFRDPQRADFVFIMYSVLTLTTVGTDALAATSRTAQAIAAVEGVIGQFYIAIIVADLVGKRMSQVLAAQSSPPPGQPLG